MSHGTTTLPSAGRGSRRCDPFRAPLRAPMAPARVSANQRDLPTTDHGIGDVAGSPRSAFDHHRRKAVTQR